MKFPVQRADLQAGLTTAVLLVPQAMAYALLAGLPPIVGLYASTLPLVIYALVGTSPVLAVGPVAIDSLMVAAVVGVTSGGDADTAVSHAIVLAALVGVLQVALGFLRLGRLAHLLTRPLIRGFTSGAALIIASSQLKHLLGVGGGRAQSLYGALAALWPELGRTHLVTLALGTVAVAVLAVLRWWRPRFPRALVVLVLASLAVLLLGPESGVAVVGKVPAGLPHLGLPSFDLALVWRLLPSAAAISVIGFVEATSVARAFSEPGTPPPDPNRELFAIGLSNLGASVVGGYPVTGGLARTAVNAGAGARSQRAALVTAAVIASTLLWFTPLFRYLPKAALAAIIVVAITRLMDYQTLRGLWQTRRSQALVFVVTALSVVVLGAQNGLFAGILAELIRRLLTRGAPDGATDSPAARP